MSATIWGKFYWSDWANDPKLKLCSLAAQGLWMRLLCIAAEANPIGYVTVNGNPLDETGIARLVGASVEDVRGMLVELDRNGVFSRDRQGRIYSRRMIKDEKKRAIARKNGKSGGNPSLGNKREISASDNQMHKGGVKGGVNTQSPDTRVQSKERDANASPKKPAASPPSRFPEFWAAYPHKVGKADALKAFDRAIRRVDFETMMVGLARYVGKTDDRPWCNPSTWLNQDRWTDQPAQPQRGHQSRSNRPMTAAELSTDLLNQMRQADESNAQDDRDQPTLDQYALPGPR